MRYRDTWHHAPETAGAALAAMDGESTMLEWDDAPGYSPDPPEHEAEYAAPVLVADDELSCAVCGSHLFVVSLDLDDDD